jgi:uncharacterized membrane protein
MENKKTSKRFAITTFNNVVFIIICIIAIIKGMNDVALACITQIGIITSFYLYGETKRPSDETERN